MTGARTPAADAGRGRHRAGQGRRVAVDTTVAHQARVYDYWLGGKDNFAADRVAGDEAIRAYPQMVSSVRANRGFLARSVRYLAGEAGIRQFLDIGTGIPSANNTHEVAQAVAPSCRIVYVDNDPVVLAHARALLSSSPEGATDYLDADVHDPASILDRAALTLDFTAPVAIMMIAVLQVVADSDDPYQIVAKLLSAVPPGSYLAVSHPASDIEPAKLAAAAARLNELSAQRRTLRSHAEVSRFFQGLDLVEPGVVKVSQWRPDSEAEARAGCAMWGGVGRKAPAR